MSGGEMVELLRELVEIESPTHSRGVRAVAERVERELRALGAETEILDGDHLRAELPGDGDLLLLVGHCDTVWDVGTLDRMPFRVDGDRAYGPGSYDMKGGLVVAVAAIAAARPRRPLRVFLSGDEEESSVRARPLLEEAARGVAAAFVLEPPSSEGDLRTGRAALGRFRLRVTGCPADTSDSDNGASAIDELAQQILALRALNDRDRGVSVNVGVVGGGTRENVVAAEAEAHVNVSVVRGHEVEHLERRLRALRPVTRGTSIDVEGQWMRPPLEPSPQTRRLFTRAREVGLELGLELGEAAPSGGSDANLLGALGVPVLDGLGAEGGGAHAFDEHVRLDSLPVRARLLAELLRDPGV